MLYPCDETYIMFTDSLQLSDSTNQPLKPVIRVNSPKLEINFEINFDKDTLFFFHENAFKIFFCKISAFYSGFSALTWGAFQKHLWALKSKSS